MEPETGKSSGFSQIYIYDQEHELENRLKAVYKLDKILLRESQDMVKEINPYAKMYGHEADMIWQNPTEDIQLVLKATWKTIDPWHYNVPTGTDIAVIVPAESTDMPSNKDVVVYRNASQHQTGKTIMKINDKHPMYDSLMYVLMFPYGDKGWEFGSFSSSNKQNKKGAAVQYYKYCLRPQGGTSCNVVHRIDRLFQQYIVDMYTKIECDRLQYIRHSQVRLYAELYQGLANAIQTAD